MEKLRIYQRIYMADSLLATWHYYDVQKHLKQQSKVRM